LLALVKLNYMLETPLKFLILNCPLDEAAVAVLLSSE
jgi:hypothetical protein